MRTIGNIAALATALSLALALTACGGGANNTATNTKRLRVVTTIFPAYDWVREILGDKADSGANEQQIERLKAESEKLNKRLHNLIEMRADGEISREVFSMKKEEAEKRLMVIQQDLDMLEPKDEEQEDPSYEDKITVLRYFMEQSLRPDNDEDIPEEVIKAFIVRIEVREDGFYWYLRFDPDNPPRHLVVEGKRKNSARVSKLCYTLHRLRLTTGGLESFVKVQEITLTLEDAKRYLYADSTKHRIHNWKDLKISVFI